MILQSSFCRSITLKKSLYNLVPQLCCEILDPTMAKTAVRYGSGCITDWNQACPGYEIQETLRIGERHNLVQLTVDDQEVSVGG